MSKLNHHNTAALLVLMAARSIDAAAGRSHAAIRSRARFAGALDVLERLGLIKTAVDAYRKLSGAAIAHGIGPSGPVTTPEAARERALRVNAAARDICRQFGWPVDTDGLTGPRQEG